MLESVPVCAVGSEAKALGVVWKARGEVSPVFHAGGVSSEEEVGGYLYTVKELRLML